MSWWSTERPDRSVANIIKAHAARASLEPSQYSGIEPILRGDGSFGGFALHPSGACGNAKDADDRRGRECIELHAQNLIALLREVHRFPITQLKTRDEINLSSGGT
jgi:hypothetical protein